MTLTQEINPYVGDLTTAEAAEFLGYSQNHMRRMRMDDTGPKFYRTGTSHSSPVRYRWKDVLSYRNKLRANGS